MKQKVLIFDFWGTLVETGVRSPVKLLKYIMEIDLPFSEYVVRMQSILMTEEFESLQDAFNAVAKEFEITLNEEQMEKLIGMWNKSWIFARPYFDVEEYINSYREDYTIVLLSNTDCFSVTKVMDKYNLTDLFDHVYLSYEHQKLKSELFPEILKDLDVKAKECVMVGDSYHSDIVPAEKIGMQAVLMDRRDKRDADKKILYLRELPRFL